MLHNSEKHALKSKSRKVYFMIYIPNMQIKIQLKKSETFKLIPYIL